MDRRLFNEIQRLKRRILRLEQKDIVVSYNNLIESGTLTSVESYRGTIVQAGTSSHSEVSSSHIVYLDSTKQWKRAAADLPKTGSAQLIGIALSTAPHTDGVLTYGLYRLTSSYISGSSAGTFEIGAQVYVSPLTSGSYTTTIPSGSGEAVRVVGHSIDSDMIYFNPSQDYIEV